MMLYIKFECLKDILEDVKEGYCNLNTDKFTDIEYISSGNMLKQLTKMAETNQAFFEDYLDVGNLAVDQDLVDKIYKNNMDKYNKIKGTFRMLFEDFNIITEHAGLLAKRSTTVMVYDVQTQGEYVIV
jgi:adenylate kinase family enzyme